MMISWRLLVEDVGFEKAVLFVGYVSLVVSCVLALIAQLAWMVAKQGLLRDAVLRRVECVMGPIGSVAEAEQSTGAKIMIDQDTGSDVPTAGMELEDRLREAYGRGKELADLTAENQRLREDRDGAVIAEGNRIAEELSNLRTLDLDVNAGDTDSADPVDWIRGMVAERLGRETDRAEQAEAALTTTRQQTLAEVLAIVEKWRQYARITHEGIERGEYPESWAGMANRAIADADELAALASSPTENEDAD